MIQNVNKHVNMKGRQLRNTKLNKKSILKKNGFSMHVRCYGWLDREYLMVVADIRKVSKRENREKRVGERNRSLISSNFLLFDI